MIYSMPFKHDLIPLIHLGIKTATTRLNQVVPEGEVFGVRDGFGFRRLYEVTYVKHDTVLNLCNQFSGMECFPNARFMYDALKAFYPWITLKTKLYTHVFMDYIP
jgi:hypothetical protein